MSYLQADLNRFRVVTLAELKKDLKKLEDALQGNRPTRPERIAIAAATEKFDTYKSQAFAVDGSTLHQKSKDAAYSMQCPSPLGFEDSGVTKFKCASGNCEHCGVYCRP